MILGIFIGIAISAVIVVLVIWLIIHNAKKQERLEHEWYKTADDFLKKEKEQNEYLSDVDLTPKQRWNKEKYFPK